MGIAVLLRHGRSVANVEGVLAGCLPGHGLHASGRDQAATVCQAFAGMAPTTIHVSPLQRTRETADIVFGADRYTTAAELLECDYGSWSGRPLTELSSDPLWEVLHRSPASVRFPDGESITEVSTRINAFIRATATEPGMHVFVTHADPIMLAVAAAAGAAVDDYQRLHVDPCSVSVIRYEERATVIAVNVPPSGAAELLQAFAASGNVDRKEDPHDPDGPSVRPA